MEKGLLNKLYLKSIKTGRKGLWHLSYNPLPSFSPPSSGRRKFPLSVCTTSSSRSSVIASAPAGKTTSAPSPGL